MDLKFYLNKFLKVDNIEGYYLKNLYEIRDNYKDFLNSTEGFDPDFPGANFGGKGKTVLGLNAYLVLGDSMESVEDIFGSVDQGLSGGLNLTR